MTDFTNPDTIHSCLGEYWYSIYYSNEQVGDYVAALCFNREQWDNQFRDTKNCLSRHKTPVFEHIKVKPVELKLSKMIEDGYEYALYNTDNIHDGKLVYGSPINSTYKLKLDENIRYISYIGNKLVDPNVTYESKIVDNCVTLPKSPFNDDFTVHNVYDSHGNIIDKYVILWLFDVEIDKEDMYYQYGYIFNLKLASSEQYKRLINALYDSLVNGPSEKTFKLYCSILTGIPVILENTEKVLSVDTNYVKTDKNEYTTVEDDPIIVTEGAELHAGDPISEGLAFYTAKNIDDSILSVSLDRRYIGICITNIVLQNKDIEIEPFVDEKTNLTRVDLPVLASDYDKKQFNDIIFERGVNNNVLVTGEEAKILLNS